MSYGNPFSRRVVVIVSTLGALSLIVGGYFALRGGSESHPKDAGAHSYSRSAIGHRAFYDLLNRLDINTTRSTGRTLHRLRNGGVLVLLEPSAYDKVDGSSRLRTLLEGRTTTLVVLPKWKHVVDEDRSGWSSHVRVRSTVVVRAVLSDLGVDAVVTRYSSPGEGWTTAETLRGSSAARTIVSEQLAPDLPFPQLIRSADLDPIVALGDEILLGEVPRDRAGDPRTLVLSDPDLLANHGIGRGDNALFAVAVIESLRGPLESVILDETIHGAVMTEGPFVALFQFPLLLVTLHVFAAAALFLAAAIGRYGAARPATSPIDRTPGFRIRNTASLLRLGGYDASGLERYFRDALRDIAAALQQRGSSRTSDLVEVVTRIAEHRKVEPGPRDLMARMTAAREAKGDKDREMLAIARDIHRFKKEMLHGAGSRT